MLDFHHFIITRFNVNIYPMDFPARLEDTWLALRFELFRKYCFPTVTAQTEDNFTWLVLFDTRTPERYRRLINIFARQKNFVPVYCDSYETTIPTVVEKMKETAPAAKWYLSTRLDNDDALSVNFVRTLQTICNQIEEENLERQETLYINFPNGLQYKEGRFFDFRDMTNAFVSLLEPSASPNTVFWVDHPSIYNVSEVIQAEGPPLWLQVVHDMNVYNYLRGEETGPADVTTHFPCLFDE
ncbi:glycosyltransferase [Desulfovibrio oxyclinae]|uniref:glycosyltransferase n=1 Tax=Desulfovibrio oxyclinae TaxID=63560 RepID=UPI00037F6D68|nr:glycosyltransferase [Desulfovibrio oxyclinae]